MLTSVEKSILLSIARQAIHRAVEDSADAPFEPRELTPNLLADGATFVTLTEDGCLRGCVGALEAYQPLAEDVWEHAKAAAIADYRFRPVEPWEIDRLRIEISRLTSPQLLEYSSPEELLTRLRPGIDGVVIHDGGRRATFLPQVWRKLSEPAQFLNHLCAKMNAPEDLWRNKPLLVYVYQVDEFQEE